MSYFGTIYADTELPSRAKAVYMYLRDRSDAEGKCWPGIKTIASDMRLSRSTVKRALHDLERHGYLKKASRQKSKREQHLQSLYREIKERVVCTTMQYKPLAVSIIISKSSAKGELRPFAGLRGGSL